MKFYIVVRVDGDALIVREHPGDVTGLVRKIMPGAFTGFLEGAEFKVGDIVELSPGTRWRLDEA